MPSTHIPACSTSINKLRLPASSAHSTNNYEKVRTYDWDSSLFHIPRGSAFVFKVRLISSPVDAASSPSYRHVLQQPSSSMFTKPSFTVPNTSKLMFQD